MTVEVRSHGSGGICTRTHPIEAVPAEVEVLARTGKFSRIEIRADGATEWRRVA